MRVKTKIDLSGVYKKVEAKTERAQAALNEQVLKDSNYFAPQDTSALINSSLLASRVGEGILIWDTPYSRKLYWNPGFNFSTDKNPNARAMWFEAAKSMFISDWIAMTQKEVNK